MKALAAILTNCRQSLAPCPPPVCILPSSSSPPSAVDASCLLPVIDLLTTLSSDSHHEVNQDANIALSKLIASLDAEEKEVAVQHITSSLHGQEIHLKKCLGLYREEGLERCLALLNGQLSLLSTLSDVPLAPVQLAAVVRGLTKAAQLEDVSPVLLNSGGLEDFASLDFLFVLFFLAESRYCY